MLNVYIKAKKEALTLCECLYMQHKDCRLGITRHEKWGHLLTVQNIEADKLAAGLVEVFLHHRETDWIAKIAKEVYYYEDLDDIQRIAELTHSLSCNGDEYEKPIAPSKPREAITAVFLEAVKESETFFYDSVIQFRSKSYEEALTHLVGIAIDEFKREEEYQLFVQNLREYAIKKQAKHDVIHVLQGSEFTFFKNSGKKFTPKEIEQLAEQEPLFLLGVGKQEKSVTPLLAMSPEQIFIYGEYPSEPRTMTIINIFQERAKYLPLHQFPFIRYEIE